MNKKQGWLLHEVCQSVKYIFQFFSRQDKQNNLHQVYFLTRKRKREHERKTKGRKRNWVTESLADRAKDNDFLFISKK